MIIMIQSKYIIIYHNHFEPIKINHIYSNPPSFCQPLDLSSILHLLLRTRFCWANSQVTTKMQKEHQPPALS